MFTLLTLLACDPVEKATHLCRERRETLDELYAEYGGSEVSKGEGVLGNVLGGADRKSFESRCLEIGRGGRPTLLTEKAKEFFARPETVRGCEKVVDMETKVAVINRELPEKEKVTCP